MSKRANGEGTLFKRKDGSWQGAVSYIDDTGARKRWTVYGKTQAEARTKLREARERLDAGHPVKDTAMTVGTWLQQWMSGALVASDRSQSTKDLYTTIARVHLVPTIGQRRLDQLRPTDVEALIVLKRDQGLAGSTIRTIYTVLRGALDVAVRDGLVKRNVTNAVKRPAVERREATYLSAEQAQELLLAVRGDRIEPIVRLMLATGLRRGEALGLHWRDVDLDQCLLRVRSALSRTSSGLQVGDVKTERSRRLIPLPRSTADMLRTHHRKQAEERLAAGPAWVDTGMVFTTEIGTPLEPRNVLRRFKTLTQRSGLDDAHLHTLRHSTASFLLASGTHIKVVQEHLGHSSYAITADIYSHVTPTQAREAADRLDVALDW
ncbi:tyrosine-type recombinase/integrase [Kineococcus sp. T13]|uniref:tyrosine-type recombinase/integrase n=1 Tax=Kineococcus vitellinus TaxID=2696565 RepID=UPI0014136B32|nr:site-specific integrase [Kineococcus vitellinus]NAZ74942.1 tyrosine-type recombinase/integrase [Kineococcus vitellinus]